MNKTDKIIEIVRREMDVFISPDTEITPDMNLAADLNVDSLDMVLVIEAIENEFGITIPNEELYEIRTISEMENKIDELLAQK